ncbi:MAG: NIPSNAP family protein, partial [Ferruginibacter sp.]
FVKILCAALLSLPFFSSAQKKQPAAEFYNITIYKFSSAAQQVTIEDFLQSAYLPALHRQHIKSVGVFTPLNNDTASSKSLYIIFPIKTLQQANDLAEKISKDDQFLINGKTYLEAVYTDAPFKRIENILLKAFPLAPILNTPKLAAAKSERIYELRSYESATENIFKNKVKMFNEGGEIDLFKRLNFNAVFYSSVIAGSHMPNLMYMTSFENMADRDEHWKKFVADPQWKKLSAMPEYQNNVSKIEITLLKPASYSDY